MNSRSAWSIDGYNKSVLKQKPSVIKEFPKVKQIAWEKEKEIDLF